MSDNIITLTDEIFNEIVLTSDIPFLVDFWASWCAPCRMIAPIVDELAAEYQGKIKVGKVNVDENRKAPVKYGITSIPTLMIFKSGKVLENLVGVPPNAKGVLKSKLESVAESHLTVGNVSKSQ